LETTKLKRLTIIVLVLSILSLATPLQIIAFGADSGGDPDAHETQTAHPANTLATVVNPTDAIVHGVYLPPINHYGTEVLAFNDLVGKDLGIVHYFTDMYWGASGYDWLVYNIISQIPEERRPAVMFTWVPMGRNCRTTPPDQAGSDPGLVISLYDILDGACDTYFRLAAQELKDEPLTLLIRFAHEMNISGSPWWAGNYNNDTQVYIDAYRHVHDVFESEGATNVQWVWGPSFASYPQEEWNSLFHYYPGDEYVDWVNLVGYNWGQWWSMPWWSLAEIFDSVNWDHVIPEVSCRYAKPIMLETASVEGSRPGDGTKAEWILEAYQQLDHWPFVKAIVWFNDWDRADPTRADFRVVGTSYRDADPWHQGYAFPLPEGNGAWTQAYSEAIARDKFISYVPPLEEITPPTTWCGGEPLLYMLDILFAEPGETQTYTLRAEGLEEDVDVALSGLPSGVTAQLSQSYLLKPQDELEVQIAVSPNRPPGQINYDISLTSPMYDIQQEGVVIVTDKISRAFLPTVCKHP
jgi:hypothetical protein